jgi:DNA polymerase-1
MIGLIDGDPIVYLAYWGKETFEEARDHADEIIENISEELFLDYMCIAIGGEYNFRDDFYSEYKKSKGRSNSRKTMPNWIVDLKEHIGGRPDAIVTDRYEADDVLRIWANQLRRVGKDHVVVSIDKDLDCIPGKHFNPSWKWKYYEVSEKEAYTLYWKQILMGDNIDNIPGLPGIGPKKADKILEACESEEEMVKEVCKQYNKAYSDAGYSYLLSNGRLIHIMGYTDDYFKLDKETYDEYIKC